MFVKKLASLTFAMALVYSISLPARAELLKNFKTDGSIEVKAFNIDNETDFNSNADDYRGETRTRILVGASFDLLDDVHSRILLRKNNRLHAQDSEGTGTGSSENLNQVQSAIAVDNAYVKIDKVFKHVDMTIGRQFYGDSNDLLIYYGLQPDDLLNVTAIDVFRADADLGGFARFQGVAGKTFESTPVSATSPAGPAIAANSDTDLWGGEIMTDKLIPKGNLGVGYYANILKGAGTAGNIELYNAEIKLNGDLPVLNGFNYFAQFVQNFGRNNGATAIGFTPATAAFDGNAYIFGLGFARDLTVRQGAMPVRAHGEFGHGSNDFASISAGKRFGIIWGEHSNVGPSSANGVGGAGLTNLIVFDFGGGFTCPVSHIGLDLNWYRFMYDEPATGAIGNTNGNTSAGSELDLILSYKHSDNVSFDVSAARFWIGDANDNTSPTGTNSIMRWGTGVKIKF